ncbi:MAG: PAS domain S-box protein [Chloroflexi bacterium]|nr:PAS domain S-box protein [Chloroflexota bacterium]
MNEQKTHILVVEDQGAHAELMRHAFASHTDRFRLTVVDSLQGARTCLSQKNRPDLVITDLLLPDGKGIELLPKDEHPPFPLVLMTSHGDEKAAADAIKAGALDYVLKSATTLGNMPRVAERALREWSHIVQRMQAEAQRDAALEALQESDLRYRALFENVPLGIGMTTMDGRILMCNDAMLQMMGHSRAELDQFDLRDSYQNPQERALLLERLQTEELVRDMEVQLKRQDGTLYHASLTLASFTLGGDDIILTLARDITEQIQIEARKDAALKALRQSQERYQVLFDRMLDGYALHEIICDDDGRAIDYRFLDINPAFERFTGLSRDIIGKRVLKVLPMTEHHWIDTYGKVALTGEPIHFENYSQGVGGKWFQVVAFSPAERQFVTIFQEVTQRKQIEEEREALFE